MCAWLRTVRVLPWDCSPGYRLHQDRQAFPWHLSRSYQETDYIEWVRRQATWKTDNLPLAALTIHVAKSLSTAHKNGPIRTVSAHAIVARFAAFARSSHSSLAIALFILLIAYLDLRPRLWSRCFASWRRDSSFSSLHWRSLTLPAPICFDDDAPARQRSPVVPLKIAPSAYSDLLRWSCGQTTLSLRSTIWGVFFLHALFQTASIRWMSRQFKVTHVGTRMRNLVLRKNQSNLSCTQDPLHDPLGKSS